MVFPRPALPRPTIPESDPWEGYPREAIYERAREIARTHGCTVTAAVGHVTRFYTAKDRLPNVKPLAPMAEDEQPSYRSLQQAAAVAWSKILPEPAYGRPDRLRVGGLLARGPAVKEPLESFNDLTDSEARFLLAVARSHDSGDWAAVFDSILSTYHEEALESVTDIALSAELGMVVVGGVDCVLDEMESPFYGSLAEAVDAKGGSND